MSPSLQAAHEELFRAEVMLAVVIIIAIIYFAWVARMIWKWWKARRERIRLRKKYQGFKGWTIEDDGYMGIGVEEWDAMHELGDL